MGTGIIGLPMIFGWSRSFHDHMVDLSERGYAVEMIHLYAGQDFQPPFFLRVILGNERRKLTRLAERFDDARVLASISEAQERLRTNGCERIVLVGFGMGAIYALKYAEKNDVAGVVGYYPHLIFPPEAKKQPPKLQNIRSPMFLIYGERDTKIEPGTIGLAKSNLTGDQGSNKRLELYPGVGHAFADRYVQERWGIHFPNPLYQREAADKAWLEVVNWIQLHSI